MKKYNFMDLISKEIEIDKNGVIEAVHFDGVTIPMIQRDYAQGRKHETDLRTRFLNSIFKTLENDGEPLELDFVYGSIEKMDDDKFFMPLDGQQRLTTLFLLHWYIAQRELTDEKHLFSLNNELSKFSYATRASARDFCEKLTKTRLDAKNSPGKQIRDSIWYFDRFEKDPTVQSMIIMLDDIHIKYESSSKNLFNSLSKLGFYILPLDGFNLTDELYIKMNARGKQLTDFENFKADLTGWLKDEKNPLNVDLRTPVTRSGESLPYYLNYSISIDNEWTDIFWSYSQEFTKLENKVVDNHFLRFINRFILNEFIVDSSLSQKAIETSPEYNYFSGQNIERIEVNSKYSSFDFYKSFFSEITKIKKLEKVLNQLVEHGEVINKRLAPSWDGSFDWTLFSENALTFRQRVFFYGVIEYLARNEFKEGQFKDWMRFLWNIVIDPQLRRIENMISNIELISKLAEHSSDIDRYLVSDAAITDFDSLQSKEREKSLLYKEREKALLFDSPEWKEEIIKAEAHKLFLGDIEFLLFDETVVDLEVFKKYRDLSFKLFVDNDLSDDTPENYNWIRAVLAQSDNIVLPISLSNNKRVFNNWRELINGKLKLDMIKLLKVLSVSKKSMNDSITEICRNYTLRKNMPWLFPIVNWQGVKGETLLGNFSETRKIQAYNDYGRTDNYVYLYNKIQWTDGNILLDTNRNYLIKEMYKKIDGITFSSDWLNVQNEFFRGWDLKPFVIKSNIKFQFEITRTDIFLGVKRISEHENKFEGIDFSDCDQPDGWFFQKKYSFDCIKPSKFEGLIEKFLHEVLDQSYPESILYKLLNKA